MASLTNPLVSIIIPTLNEETALPLLLADIALQQGVSLEVLVGDGGSTDGTEAAARAGGACFFAADRGRGAQMNAAARLARGVYLLFLHADSRIEDPRLVVNAVQALREASWSASKVAGHFSLHFKRSTPGNDLAFRYMEAKTRLNRSNTTNGDQGFFLSRQWFGELGGFDERMPFLEDQRLAERIRAEGRWMTLPGVLTTSARRFEVEGFCQRYLSMGLIMVAYSTGLEGFFLRLTGLYRVHQQCGRLLLFPILLGFFTALFAGLRLGQIAERVEKIGRYLAENCWQPVFLLEVCWQRVSERNGPNLLRLYDRFLAPVLRYRFWGHLIGWVAVMFFGGLVTPLVGFAEWLQRLKTLEQ